MEEVYQIAKKELMTVFKFKRIGIRDIWEGVKIKNI